MTLNAYQNRQAVDIVKRVIRHQEAGTTDTTEDVFRVPAADYFGDERWQEEMDATYRSLPLMLALSIELPDAGDYRAMKVLDTPVLIVRGKDMQVRAFINACGHRGRAITQTNDETGNARRFVCPYHAWTFDDRGALIGVSDQQNFGAVDKQERGLKALPCEERAGMIFVCITPGRTFDLEHFLGGMLDELASFDLDQFHVWSQNAYECPNWKSTIEGFLEVYHLPFLHANTLMAGMSTRKPTIAIYDWYGALPSGPHQRMCSSFQVNPDKVKGLPEDEWTDDQLVGGVRFVFPNVSIAISGSGGLVTRLMPLSPMRSVSVQTYFFRADPAAATQAEKDRLHKQIETYIAAAVEEDNTSIASIEEGLKSGAREDYLIGRNEGGVQRWHKSLRAYVDAHRGETARQSA